MDQETTNVAAQTEAATAAPQAAKSLTNRRKFLTEPPRPPRRDGGTRGAEHLARPDHDDQDAGRLGAQDILNEFAEDYVTRVNEMGGDRLQIDYLISGRW